MFLEAIKSGYKNDPMFSKVLENPGHYLNFRVFEGIIHTKNRLGDECLCIPRALYKGKHSLPEVTIDHAHDTWTSRISEDIEYARRWLWWPRMGCDIEKFCLSCETCQMSKSSNQLKPGLLHSLPIPSCPWQSIGMDFIGPFPVCQGYDYLWVIICQFTNQSHLIPLPFELRRTNLHGIIYSTSFVYTVCWNLLFPTETLSSLPDSGVNFTVR